MLIFKGFNLSHLLVILLSHLVPSVLQTVVVVLDLMQALLGIVSDSQLHLVFSNHLLLSSF